MTVKAFEVGGIVRDDIIGVKSNDVDYTVTAPSFEDMRQFVIDNGMKIVVETPEFYTIRAVARESFQGRKGGLDFVWAREEGPYSDGRRPDWVKPGTLFMDQQRRDFTMNAIAKDADGSLIDPFNGQADIRDRIISAVGDPMERLTEDALRAVRAVRFAVTKNFAIEPTLARALQSRKVLRAIEEDISDERIQVELSKMFRFDTIHSIWILSKFPRLTEAMFAGSVSLDATMKTKGRGA